MFQQKLPDRIMKLNHHINDIEINLLVILEIPSHVKRMSSHKFDVVNIQLENLIIKRYFEKGIKDKPNI